MSGEHSGNFFTSSWTHLHALFQARPLSTATRSRQQRSLAHRFFMDLGAARLLVEDGVEVGALPTNYNFKIAPCDPHHDARRQAIGAAHLVRGPVRLIHHKALKHPHGLCKLVNAQQQYSGNAAASATRVVVGATACAMHDLSEIRVHEISDGSPWLAGD